MGLQQRGRDKREITPDPFEFFFGHKRESGEEEISEIEKDWIPFLEWALEKARRQLAERLKGQR